MKGKVRDQCYLETAANNRGSKEFTGKLDSSIFFFLILHGSNTQICHCSISIDPKCVLTTVAHVKESIFILVFLIYSRHHGSCNNATSFGVTRSITGNVYKILNQNTLNVISPVGGRMFFTKMKIAFSGLSLILFRTTYTNWPTVRSAGTKYLLIPKLQIKFPLR